MRKKPVLSAACVVCAAVLFLTLAWRVRQVVPLGLRLRSFVPFYFASRDLGTFSSPEGTNEVTVIINDAGAMHSGNHWTWIIKSSPHDGGQVVAEGYLLYPDTCRETLPLRWLSERKIEVRFRQGRRSRIEVVRTYSVP